MRSAKTAELVLEKLLYIHLPPARLMCNRHLQALEAFSAWVWPGELLLQTPWTGMNSIYWKKTISDMWH